MIDLDKRFSPNWWDYSFGIEVDFKSAPFQRCGYYFERPFNAENFLHAMNALSLGYGMGGSVFTLAELVKHDGNMRVRPGQLWNCKPATNYKGDVYDLPIVWDPFTKFPFGPMVEKR